MFYSRSTNRRINHLHERVHRLIYNGYKLTLEELLEKDRSFTIHHYNIQTLCTELHEKNTVTCHKRFSVICLHINLR